MIDAFARSCSNNESAMGIPAISAGPSNGTETCSPASGAQRRRVLVAVSAAGHTTPAARRRRVARTAPTAHPWTLHPLGSARIVASNSGAHLVGQLAAVPQEHVLLRVPTHPQRTAPRTAPANPLPTASTPSAPRRANSIGSMFGARAAHSRSDSSSANCTTDAQLLIREAALDRHPTDRRQRLPAPAPSPPCRAPPAPTHRANRSSSRCGHASSSTRNDRELSVWSSRCARDQLVAFAPATSSVEWVRSSSTSTSNMH